jgi:hypothetical protein
MDYLSNVVSFFFLMAYPQSLQKLREYLPNNILWDIVSFLFTFLNQLGHVPILTIFHNNVNSLCFLINYSTNNIKITICLLFIILDNVRVVKLAEDVDLIHDLYFFSFIHFTIVNLFPDQDLAIRLPFYLLNWAVTTWKRMRLIEMNLPFPISESFS